jgi:hypoxanthine phosphoribosyltransferase
MTPDIQRKIRALHDAPLRVLIGETTLQERIHALGEQLSEDFRNLDPVLVCVLKGSLPFFVDLSRSLHVPHTWDMLQVSSYEGGTSSTGVVKVVTDLSETIEGRHVLLVEDIVDTGRTIAHLRDLLHTRRPASLSVVALLDKPSRRVMPVQVDYVGFTIEDAFVVGYGLDYGQYLRDLRHVAVVDDAVTE